MNNLPCTGCIYNTKESLTIVYCSYGKTYGHGKTPAIDGKNKIKDGLEIIPKLIFYPKDSTCAAMSV